MSKVKERRWCVRCDERKRYRKSGREYRKDRCKGKAALMWFNLHNVRWQS